MSGATRDGDEVACPHDPADGKTVKPNPVPTVRVNSRAAAAISVPVDCPAILSLVTTGAATVRIHGQPAARVGEHTTDGQLVEGSANVRIGGPSCGGTLGATVHLTTACEAAAATRDSGSKAQSHGNCGLESWRTAINQELAKRGLPPETEEGLLAWAIAKGRAGDHPGYGNHGCTNADARVYLAETYGIAAETQEPTEANIEQAVLSRKHITVSVHPLYWEEHHGQKVEPDPKEPSSWLHEIAVTGIEYGPDGKVVAYFVNDTATGECGYRIPAARFSQCMERRLRLTVSQKAVW